ncbi:FTR1 family protein [Teredinibacter turnerae]|uniref:FTR1 family protein n=1 Tax=Teredinibacter turnerae TaxID=2426 RepID=UPI00037F2858|nr:FTR1 family protein [Teredinibacter turnerae]
MFFPWFNGSKVHTAMLLLISILSVNCIANTQIPDYRQMAQLAEYIGVDYPEAIDSGEIINNAEYQEMLEFSGILITQAKASEIDALVSNTQALETAIKEKQAPSVIQQLCNQLRTGLLEQMPQAAIPQQLLPVSETQSLFQQQCSACHGTQGKGDGHASVGLEPPPTNFTDRARALNRSILGLYDAISNGIDETAMVAYEQLSEQQRWSLAFYAGSLAFEGQSGAVASTSGLTLDGLINHSPSQLASGDSDTLEKVAQLRASPQVLFSSLPSPLGIARNQLLAARTAYENNQVEEANRLAVSAYLDGFELVENSLDTRDPDLRKQIEVNMMALRKQFRNTTDRVQLETSLNTTLAQLDSAEQLLSADALSDATLFSASLIILLREGLEALLVTLALAMVLIRSDRGDALKYVHVGWVSALVAGGITWWAARSFISISGASREVMEGAAALAAAVVLFYVGVWMHSKTHAAQWQAYIQKHVTERLKTGTLWGITGLAFVAVYREVFETVLFYEALLTQSLPAQTPTIISGFVVGTLCLSVIAWAMVRYSFKLPIGRFFSVTTYLLVGLSFVLIGKGVIALQEAAIIGISPLPISFEIDWIGLKSTWQSLFGQVTVVVLFAVFAIHSRFSSVQRT